MRLNVIPAAAGTRFDELRDAMREHGSHSLAYSTLQPNMKYHSCASGYLAYRTIHEGKTVAVLGDPVCSTGDLEECLVGFLDIHPQAIFLQISELTAQTLQGLGLYVNPFGKECWLDLNPPIHSDVEKFKLDGPRRERLRTTRNRCRREGLRIEELSLSAVDPAVLVDISREWLSTKRVASELQFLARPLGSQPISDQESPGGEDFSLQDEDGVRLFVARSRANVIVGFVLFDPVYRYGRVESYAASILRCRRTFVRGGESLVRVRVPSGLVDAIILAAVDQFQSEGIRALSLGLMPFMPDNRKRSGSLHRNPLSDVLFNSLYRFGNKWFGFRSLSWHKRRYFGREEVVYFAAAQQAAQLWHLHQTNRMMGVRYIEAARNALTRRG